MASVNPSKESGRHQKVVSMATLDTPSSRIASRRLTRAVTLLTRAGRQLYCASLAAPDRFNRDRLHFFADGLRELSLPLARIASRLEKAGER